MKLILLAGLASGSMLFGAATYFSVPPADAPELAARGPYDVGVRTLEVSPQRAGGYRALR